MPSRIVTYIHHPKRAPRKKAEAAAGPAVVQSSVKPGNDNGLELAPKSAIVQAATPTRSHGRLGGRRQPG